MEDLYSTIGLGQMSASSFVVRLKEENILSKESNDINKTIEEQIHKSEKKASKDSFYGVTVKGESNLMVRFAKCCNPVPGDEIKGYITKGRGVSIHRMDCSNLKALIDSDPNKVIEVSWGKEKGASYVAGIRIIADDRMGILQDVMSVITDSGVNLTALNANSGKSNEANIDIKVKISSVDTLKRLMKKINSIKGVAEVYRVNS